MSQKSRILDALRLESCCSLSFLDWEPRITRAAARVQDLRDEGHDIISKPCQLHPRPTAAHVVYELVVSDQMRLAI